MYMKKVFISIFIAAFSILVTGQITTPKITFSEAVFPANTSWSIYVADALTGEVISDKDGSLNLAPASVMKLIPTAAALKLLGEDYRFTTSLAFSGKLNQKKGELVGNIIIIGGGDPMLGSPNYINTYGDVIGNWVSSVKGAGIKKIKGDIIADASVYDYQPVPGGWEWEDVGNYYGAGIHGLNYMNNSFSIYLQSKGEGTTPVIDSVESAGRFLKINNYLVARGYSDKGIVYSSPYLSEITLGGVVSANSHIILKAAIPDPPLATAQLLRERLISGGINITGVATTRRVESSNDSLMEMLSTTISPSLKEMITTTNQESINLFAGQLCKHLGLIYRDESSFDAGMEVIKSLLDTINIPTNKIILADPSGLSRNNAVSAEFMTGLLRYIYNSQYKETFISSMPVSGVSGTLKKYFSDDLLKERVIAKTGSMSQVRSLAGYVTASSGRVMVFTIIVNGFTAPDRDITGSIEEIIKSIIINY
jgi:serine-type D-Ala-D-Ala carboxypeptidase/endopeptidase (penicillin-binding protein 4)